MSSAPALKRAESPVSNWAESPVCRVGLLGWPVEHSVSPAMHNAAFAALGLDRSYSLLPTPPGGVGRALADLKSAGFLGANVKVPHKQAVLPYLDRITADARAMGAVNTIQVQADDLLGDNTDGAGFQTLDGPRRPHQRDAHGRKRGAPKTGAAWRPALTDAQ